MVQAALTARQAGKAGICDHLRHKGDSNADERRNERERSFDRLVALFDALTPQEAGVSVKKMLGWPCCFLNGNLFARLHKQSMIFRRSDADRTAFLELGGTGEFEPIARPANERLRDHG
jgi:hypothetical protein